MRNNDTQHIVRLSAASLAQTVLPQHAPLRAHHEEEIVVAKSLSFTLARGFFGKVVTLLLLPMIFVYPLAPLYAADETVTEAVAVPTAPETPPSETPAPETPAETSAPVDTTPSPADGGTSLAQDLGSAVSGALAVITGIFSSDEEAATTTTETTGADAGGSEEHSTTTEVTDGEFATGTASTTLETGDASTTPITGGESASTTATTTEIATTTDATSDTASTTETISETASTTPQIVPEKTAQEIAQEMLAEKEDLLRASIRKEVEDEYTKGCVALDTTGYYCLKDRINSGASLTPSNVVTSVSSQPDASGQWKQIFMTRSGVEEQLTHNAWDNAFPTTDVSGKSIVWQGNLSGRWQIFFANAATSGVPEITQLTHGTESNFNPKVDGSDVVWQGWVDGNWEIFLAQRLSPDAYYATDTLPAANKLLAIDNSWKVTRITANSGHDMFPAVAGGLVTWQSFQDGAWNVYVYSIKTGGTQKISSSGEKSEKPRFAITWDERTVDGNARMVGYDIATGKTIDITSEARQVNDESAPYKQPAAPISQPDQAALPATSATGTNGSAKDDGDGGDTNGLDV